MRHRVQALIIQDNNAVFGYGCGGKNNEFFHCFIGGGLEEGETVEQALIREVMEEMNVKGEIIFKFNNELKENHTTFLVNIGNQKPTLGYDPEETNLEFSVKALQQLLFIPLKSKTKFTKIDMDYFKLLLDECKTRNYYPGWYGELEELISC